MQPLSTRDKGVVGARSDSNESRARRSFGHGRVLVERVRVFLEPGRRFLARGRPRGRGERIASRVATIALFAILGLYAVYFVTANVLLRTRVLRNLLSEDEQQMTVAWTSGWSIVPTRVELRGFAMRFQDSNVQFSLAIDKVTLDVDLWQLTKKTFHTTRVRGEGATFLARHKVESAKGQEARLAAHPPIPGFADPPLASAVKSPPLTDENYNLWTVHLEDVATSARELWLMEYRLRGELSVAGGFRLKPVREFELAPSVLLARNSVIGIGNAAFLEGSTLKLEATIPRFDVNAPKGLEMLKYVTASVDLDGAVSSVAPFGSTYLTGGKFGVDGGKGTLSAYLRVTNGAFGEASKVDYRTERILVRAQPFMLTGGATVAARVKNDAMAFDLSVAEASLAGLGAPAAAKPMRVEGASARLTVDGVDVAKPRSIAGTAVSARSVHAPDLRSLGPAMPEGAALEGGARASISASKQGDVIDGKVDVALEGAKLRLESIVVAATGRASTTVATDRASHAITFARTSADLHDVAIRIKDTHAEHLTVRTRVERGSLKRTSPKGDPDAFEGTVSVQAGPGDRTINFLAGVAGLPAPFVKWAAEADSGTPFSATMKIAVSDAAKDVRLVHAENGRLLGRGAFRKVGEKTAGAFLVGLGGVTAGIALGPGGVDVTPLADDAWLQKRLSALP